MNTLSIPPGLVKGNSIPDGAAPCSLLQLCCFGVLKMLFELALVLKKESWPIGRISLGRTHKFNQVVELKLEF